MLRLHDFMCDKCRVVDEHIVEGNETPKCLICDTPMRKLPSLFKVNMGPVGAYGYYDENLETYVDTNKKRRELMRKRGVCEKGATPKPDGDAWV